MNDPTPGDRAISDGQAGAGKGGMLSRGVDWRGVRRVAERAAGATDRIQGIYFVITGVWPLVSIRSFQWVTGRKTDLWLVKTVGILVGLIGVVLLRGGRTRSRSLELELLAVGSALGLTGIDVVYVARRRISPIYLLDAVAELGLVAGWLLRRRS